jgi:hypothetical protein
MDKTILSGIVMGLTLTGAVAWAQSNQTPGVDAREANQQRRIAEGIQSGQLTPREAARLERGEARINRMEQRAKADGVVTPRERARLHGALNHESRAIARQKHDAQHR